MTGMMENGNGKIHHVEIVIPALVGAINLHPPRCLLGPHPMLDLFPHGWMAAANTLLVCYYMTRFCYVVLKVILMMEVAVIASFANYRFIT